MDEMRLDDDDDDDDDDDMMVWYRDGPGPGTRDSGPGPKAAAGGRPNLSSPQPANVPRDEISRSGEPLTPRLILGHMVCKSNIYIYI